MWYSGLKPQLWNTTTSMVVHTTKHCAICWWWWLYSCGFFSSHFFLARNLYEDESWQNQDIYPLHYFSSTESSTQTREREGTMRRKNWVNEKFHHCEMFGSFAPVPFKEVGCIICCLSNILLLYNTKLMRGNILCVQC